MMAKSYRHQWRVLIILFMTWGFTGLARNSIAFLFPYFSLEFGLGAEHNGYLAATVAFFWAMAIIFLGDLAGRIGQPKVMVPGMCVGAIALVLFGLTHQVVLLYLFAAVFGFGCGSMCSPSISMIAEQSNPKNRGMFLGIMESGFSLIGSALGAIVITRIGADLGWRGCYILIAVLVFLTAMTVFGGLWRIPRQVEVSPQKTEKAEKHSFKELAAYRNIVITTILTCIAMMWYFTVAAFAIIYLMEGKGFSTIAAGAIFSGYGLGGFCGEVVIPTLSDRLGRKRTVLLCTVIGTVSFAAFLLLDLPALALTVCLFLASLFFSGLVPLPNSVIPSEAVPQELVPTAISFTPAVGELFGGVLSPALAGVLAGSLGITNVMYVLLVMPIILLVGGFLLTETAPAVLAKRQGTASL